MNNPKVELHVSQGTQEMTKLGVITLELNPEKAPKSVANFLSYVKKGFYNGVIFHRVTPGFVIQSGAFLPGMVQKPATGLIENEATNGLKNSKYTLAVARTSLPHSGISQFFINVENNHFLDHTARTLSDWGYAVFGKVADGFEVVDQIARTEVRKKMGFPDVPIMPIIIDKAVLISS